VNAPGNPGRPRGSNNNTKTGPRGVLDPTSFQTYIFRVMKEVKPELSISKKAMMLVNNILAELFIKIMQEARNLMIFSKKTTLSSKEIESSIKLHFPGELMKLAIQTSRGSLQKFTNAE
jgi:histone H2B